MVTNNYVLNLNINQSDIQETDIRIVQNDYNVNVFEIHIFDEDNEINYADVDSGIIIFKQAYKDIVKQGDLVKSADKLTFTLKSINFDGDCLGSIQLFGANDERITTTYFKIKIIKDLITDKSVKTTSEYPILQQIKQDVGDIVPLIPQIEETIQDFPVIRDFFDTAEVSENQRVVNEIARQASISDIENRFNTLTTSQQQEAEVIDARMGKVSLRAKIEDMEADTAAHKADYANKFPDNAGAHNSIFRGKNLGSTPDYANITDGSFKDMYIGDYWTINGVNWRIAAFNYYRNTGDTNVSGNHVVIVPDTSLYSHVMNDTNTTEGGYTGSKMYTEGLEEAKTIINNAFPGHVVIFRRSLCNAVANGEASGGAWVDSTVDLMNEVMVYGSIINGHSTYGLHNIGAEKSQLPLFALNPQSINTRYNYWLRDIASASDFAFVFSTGVANRYGASTSVAVRPAFLIS